MSLIWNVRALLCWKCFLLGIILYRHYPSCFHIELEQIACSAWIQTGYDLKILQQEPAGHDYLAVDTNVGIRFLAYKNVCLSASGTLAQSIPMYFICRLTLQDDECGCQNYLNLTESIKKD